MPRVDVAVESPIIRSFRVEQCAGMFDLAIGEKSSERFSVEVPGLDEPWQIGAIVGPSGSGKSTVTRHAYGSAVIGGFTWPRDRALLDGFPSEMSLREMTAMLGSVGFSSPPAWLGPHHVLSNGERFRCDLARALCLAKPVVAIDEFTSVVDRTVARIASVCVNKAIREGQARCKRIVVVTCHHDVLDWLEPDWVLDMADGGLARGRLRQRPKIQIDIHRCETTLWRIFSRHHYLSGDLHPQARCYAAWWEGRPVAFCATLQTLGHRGRRRVHRLVVLPDFQGVGIGTRLLSIVAGIESVTHRLSIRTSHPSLIRSLAKQPTWRVMEIKKVGRRQKWTTGSPGRCTVAFEYLRQPEI